MDQSCAAHLPAQDSTVSGERMYHIKTDIRQYRCESEDKVERLIRNWVIRPSDLIFHADEEAWKPIGQHPVFNDIFEGIELEESNEPDTVVTDPPSELAAEHEVEPGAEREEIDDRQTSEGDKETDELEASDSGAEDDEEPDSEEGEEVTQIVGDDGLEEESGAEEDEEVTQIVAEDGPEEESGAEEGEEVTQIVGDDGLEEESDAEEGEEVTQIVGEDGLEEESDEHEEPASEAAADTQVDAPPRAEAKENDEPPRIIEPPEPAGDVEGVARDSDEITLMTEETLERMREDVEEADAPESSTVSEADEEPSSLEESSQPTDLSETSDLPEVDSGESDESSTGRHGLPEEVFVTDEIRHEDVENDGGSQEAELGAETSDSDGDPGREGDELDEMLDDAARLVGLGGVVDDPASDTGDDSAAVGTESDEHPDIEVEALPDPHELKKEAYRVSLPIDISPTPEDIRLGLKHSRLDRRQKDAVFPHPRPKKAGEIITRRYDLSAEVRPARSDARWVVAALIGLVVVLALLVVVLR
ncbi:MAG: hypothetical protein ACOCV2_12115 [Persicimonas sp.]